MRRWTKAMVFAAGVAVAAIGYNSVLRAADEAPKPASDQPHVMAATPVDAGRYIVTIAACNDCHTPGYMEKGNDVPESEWLTGVPVGWKGPWGTTYGSNLRLVVKAFTEDDFVNMMHTRNARPPMPWAAVHKMSDQDLRSVYKFIKTLKPAGKPAPMALGPGEQPKGPYFLLDPEAAAKAGGASSSSAPPAQ